MTLEHQDARKLVLEIASCPAGGYIIRDGSAEHAGDIMAKTTLHEAQSACGELIGHFFSHAAALEDDETFVPPRVMREDGNVVRPPTGFFRRLMGGRA